MYTIVDRRKMNRERAEETLQRARSEFFPKLQSAEGFVGFYLVRDDQAGENVAIIVFEDKAHADAFQAEGDKWRQVLTDMGHTIQSHNTGDAVVSLEARRS